MHDVFVERPTRWLEQARERSRDLPRTNFNMGCDFSDRGKFFDALFRFRVVAFLNDRYPNLWYNIGLCYYHLEKHAQATRALKRALQQEPGNAQTLFLLATIAPSALSPQQQPQIMPTAMVQGFFASVAENYDQREAENRYVGGKVSYDLVKPLVSVAAPHILDLGCGSGIAARPWRQTAAHIAGVDITPAMAAQAIGASHAGRALFDAVYTQDMRSLPEAIAPASIDLVLLINVAQFLGTLEPVLREAARVMKPGAALVLSHELSAETPATGFHIGREHGRFAHGQAYIATLATALGLALKKSEKIELYAEIAAAGHVLVKE
jgi:predicted TPR repeat methyltransferase